MPRPYTKNQYTSDQIQAYALIYDCTEKTIRNYIKAGIDLNDQNAVADYRAKQGKTPNPLREKKLKAEINKLEEGGKLAKIKRLEAEKQLVNMNDVLEAQQKIAAILNAKLSNFINDLPPLIVGLTEKQMMPIIRDKVKLMLDDLSEYNYNAEE